MGDSNSPSSLLSGFSNQRIPTFLGRTLFALAVESESRTHSRGFAVRCLNHLAISTNYAATKIRTWTPIYSMEGLAILCDTFTPWRQTPLWDSNPYHWFWRPVFYPFELSRQNDRVTESQTSVCYLYLFQTHRRFELDLTKVFIIGRYDTEPMMASNR